MSCGPKEMMLLVSLPPITPIDRFGNCERIAWRTFASSERYPYCNAIRSGRRSAKVES